MAFALGDIIIDRVQYGYAEDFSGTPLYTLTQLQDATINISAESTDAVDNTGAIVKRFWKAKTGEFTANNAMINLNIIAAGAGEGSATLAETKAFDMPRIITATQDGTGAVTVKLGESADVKEESIKVNVFNKNGSMGTLCTKDSAAAETKYSYSEGTLALPKTAGTYIIKYERNVSKDGVKIVNEADKFPSTVKLTLKALAVDPCTPDTLRGVYIVIPSFQVSPEVEISLTTDGQLQYSGQMQMNYCAADKALYEVYFADGDEE